MKLILSSLAILMLSFQTLQSQVIELSTEKPNQESSDYYALLQTENNSSTSIILSYEDVSVSNFYTMEQNKKTKTAWILLGSGAALMIGSAVWYGLDASDSLGYSANEGTQATLFLIGGVASLVSIPFFISASSNKHKAMTKLSGEMVSLGNGTIRNSNSMALALSVKF